MAGKRREPNGTDQRMNAKIERTIVPTVCLLLLAGSGYSADQVWTSAGGLYRVSFTSELDPIEINRIHSWVLHVEGSDGDPLEGAEITLEGGMPAHDHGLPTLPRITAELGNGDYRVEGMRFHMGGDWEITVTISADDDRETCVISLQL